MSGYEMNYSDTKAESSLQLVGRDPKTRQYQENVAEGPFLMIAKLRRLRGLRGITILVATCIISIFVPMFTTGYAAQDIIQRLGSQNVFKDYAFK